MGEGLEIEKRAAAVVEGKTVETLGGGIEREAEEVLAGGRATTGEEDIEMEGSSEMREEMEGDSSVREEKM
ncbi:hypothetical protein KI387_015295, partial [Taxus chinensis]